MKTEATIVSLIWTSSSRLEILVWSWQVSDWLNAMYSSICIGKVNLYFVKSRHLIHDWLWIYFEVKFQANFTFFQCSENDMVFQVQNEKMHKMLQAKLMMKNVIFQSFSRPEWPNPLVSIALQAIISLQIVQCLSMPCNPETNYVWEHPHPSDINWFQYFCPWCLIHHLER